MQRAILVFILVIFIGGCASDGDEALAPKLRYSFVVDGRVEKIRVVPTETNEISVAVQPRGGESAIWQIYEASSAFIALEIDEKDETLRGGRKLEMEGEVSYYRDLKTAVRDGNDVVVRGKPMRAVEVASTRVTVEPGAPALVYLSEGLQLEIALVPPDGKGAAAKR